MSVGTTVGKMIFVRSADPKKEPVLDWMEKNKERNEYQAKVFNYPKTEVLAAYNTEKTSGYMPVQPVALIDSYAPNPEATIHETTAALIELVKAVALLAHKGGLREVIFLVNDPKVQVGAEYLGFKEIDAKVMRLELPNE